MDRETEKKIFDFKLFLQDDFLNQDIFNEQYFSKVSQSKKLIVNSWFLCLIARVSFWMILCKFLIFKVAHWF